VSRRPRPGRTTVLVGLALALVLALAYAVTRLGPQVHSPAPPPRPVPSPATATPVAPDPGSTAAPAVPRPGRAYPLRDLGALHDRSALVPGRGPADLRYARAPGNGTRLHFICTGCDADTWLVELPRGVPVGGGPLPDPSDATGALDTGTPDPVDTRPGAPGRRTDLLVRAPAGSSWTVTLTPFDAVPLHEQTFDALDDDVVAVRARGDLELACGGPLVARTLARLPGEREYVVGRVQRHDAAGTYPVAAPAGTDRMVVVVACAGRWTLTLP